MHFNTIQYLCLCFCFVILLICDLHINSKLKFCFLSEFAMLMFLLSYIIINELLEIYVILNMNGFCNFVVINIIHVDNWKLRKSRYALAYKV